MENIDDTKLPRVMLEVGDHELVILGCSVVDSTFGHRMLVREFEILRSNVGLPGTPRVWASSFKVAGLFDIEEFFNATCTKQEIAAVMRMHEYDPVGAAMELAPKAVGKRVLAVVREKSLKRDIERKVLVARWYRAEEPG